MHILDDMCSDGSQKALTVHNMCMYMYAFHHCSLRAKDYLPVVQKESTATQWVKQYLKPK